MINNSKYEILTPNGFVNFDGIKKLKKNKYFEIKLNTGKILKCSYEHRFILDNIEIFAYELYAGCKIDSNNGESVFVDDIKLINSNIELYDVINVRLNNIFNVDGVVSHNCDTEFITSGQSVIDGLIIEEYREKQVTEPIEKRGVDSNVWIWKPPNYTKDYIVCADVSRGDSTDYSAFHVIDIESLEQVAEYKGRLGTREYGNLLVNMSVEYNNALLVIENNNIGWAAIQQVIDREYDNLFYMSKDLQIVDTHKQINNKINRAEKQLVPGFTLTQKTRPLVIAKLEEFFREKLVTVHSQRLIDELFVFIWNGSKAEAMRGYNDDLVISFAIGLWIRETALRLRAEGIELQKKALNSITTNQGVYLPTGNKNDSWEIEIGKEKESLEWLIN